MALLNLSKKAPVILVDASYYIFYRYFATSRWWSFQNRGDAQMSNPEFQDAFLKHADAEIHKLRKTWGLIGKGKVRQSQDAAPENLIFCQDCPRASIWRMDMYDAYKGTRPVNEKFDPNAFRVYLDRAATTASPVLPSFPPIVSHPRLEADDVACLLFRQIRETMGPEQKVIFITGDHDYLQLKDEHSEIFSLPLKNLWEAGVKKGTDNIHRKIVMGDASDNIPAILTKKQIGVYMELEANERTTFIEGLGKTAAFERNQTLMCWSKIPEDLVNSFNEKWRVSPSPKK